MHLEECTCFSKGGPRVVSTISHLTYRHRSCLPFFCTIDQVEDMGAAVLAAGGNNSQSTSAAKAAAAAAEEKADGSKGSVLAGLTEELLGGSEEQEAAVDDSDGGAVVVRPEMVTPLQRKVKENWRRIERTRTGW